ncbi:MAG: peroxiredoxin [Rhodobacteraceae bacterium]|nr:peroxiredoxin [Paracoccaceae bacterium]
MAITVGKGLPDAVLLKMGDAGPETVRLGDRLRGRRVVIFGLPGAFTSTCTSAHVPSFIRTKPGFDAKGVDEIICISVNDPFVMRAWGDATGASQAGITMLADPGGDFTIAAGMAFSAPAVGFINRSQRYALFAEDGVVKVFHPEESRSTCEASGGEALLAAI